jgi:hypothetical protein
MIPAVEPRPKLTIEQCIDATLDRRLPTLTRFRRLPRAGTAYFWCLSAADYMFTVKESRRRPKYSFALTLRREFHTAVFDAAAWMRPEIQAEYGRNLNAEYGQTLEYMTKAALAALCVVWPYLDKEWSVPEIAVSDYERVIRLLDGGLEGICLPVNEFDFVLQLLGLGLSLQNPTIPTALGVSPCSTQPFA